MKEGPLSSITIAMMNFVGFTATTYDMLVYGSLIEYSSNLEAVEEILITLLWMKTEIAYLNPGTGDKVTVLFYIIDRDVTFEINMSNKTSYEVHEF